MLHMPTFHQHVVNVHFDVATDLIFKDIVDNILVCGSHIFHTKGHQKSLVCKKGYLFSSLGVIRIWLYSKKAPIELSSYVLR